jgi:hypothetical protein
VPAVFAIGETAVGLHLDRHEFEFIEIAVEPIDGLEGAPDFFLGKNGRQAKLADDPFPGQLADRSASSV